MLEISVASVNLIIGLTCYKIDLGCYFGIFVNLAPSFEYESYHIWDPVKKVCRF